MAFSSLSLSIVRRWCVRMNVCVWVLCTSEMKRNLAVIKKNSPNRASNNRNVYTMLWCANTDSFAGACADLTGAWPVFPVFHKISSGSLRNIYMCVCVDLPYHFVLIFHDFASTGSFRVQKTTFKLWSISIYSLLSLNWSIKLWIILHIKMVTVFTLLLRNKMSWFWYVLLPLFLLALQLFSFVSY